MAISRFVASVVVAALSLGATAATPAPRLTAPLTGDAEVRWQDGLVVAHGLGLADRRAPSVSTAQAAARRRAEADARAKLATGLAKLPGAPGWGVTDAAFVRSAALAPDGSWQVEVALPVAAHRAPRQVTATTDDSADATAVVVDARAVTITPDATPGFGGAATIWRTAEPAADVLGPRVERRVATLTADGVLTLDGAPLKPTHIDSALVVMLVAEAS